MKRTESEACVILCAGDCGRLPTADGVYCSTCNPRRPCVVVPKDKYDRLLADSERCERLEGLPWTVILDLIKECAEDTSSDELVELWETVFAALEVPDGD